MLLRWSYEISNQVEFVINTSNISEEIKMNAIKIANETAEQFNLMDFNS